MHTREPGVHSRLRRTREEKAMGEAADVILGELAAVNARDLKQIVASFSTDCPKEVPGVALRGGEEIAAWCTALWEAFPDLHLAYAAVAEEGPVAVVEGVVAGTHLGTLRTANGDIPPTGRRVEVKFSESAVVEGGVVVSARMYFDRLALLEQLGVAPVPAPA
jgi:predicted ester cyclase